MMEMETHLGYNNKLGMFVTSDDWGAEISFQTDDILHRILVNSEYRIKVVRGAEDIFNTQVEDYVMSIDGIGKPKANSDFLVGYYESKIYQLLGRDISNDIISKAHELARLHDEEMRGDL